MAADSHLTKLAHFSNMFRLAALAQSDLMLLQGLLVVASGANGLFNLLQPKPLWTELVTLMGEPYEQYLRTVYSSDEE